MGEINEDSNKKDSILNSRNQILLLRNKPVALVVGAAGFLGSFLVEKLLEKGIQVVGVDDLRSGKRENLEKSQKDKNFHLIIESPERLNLDLLRLDYLFVASENEFNISNLLEQFKKTKCRLLFISSIDLYDKEFENNDLEWFKIAEGKIAKFATDNHLNARILRLGPVFGPRMYFKAKDPLVRLIQQALVGDLQKDISLEFSSRALYVLDAVDLIIKTIFLGATAQKIFDGVSPAPVQVSEIKQVLLDPLWYESRDFTPTLLPPWPTPNLDKTIMVLNWHPKQKLVINLRETLSYFKDNEIVVPKLESQKVKEEKPEEKEVDIYPLENKWKEEKKENLEIFKEGLKLKKSNLKINSALSKVYVLGIVALVSYALLWPMLSLGWGIITFRQNLSAGFKNLEKGEFEKSLENIDQATAGVNEAKAIFNSFEAIRKTGYLKDQFAMGDELLRLSYFSTDCAKKTVLGIEALFKGLKATTGELNEESKPYFDTAKIELTSASESLSRAQAILQNESFTGGFPEILKDKISELSEKLALYTNLINKSQALSAILPNLVAVNGSKSYLILLQNNMELRPTGGFIGSFAKVNFEGGKLKKLDTNDIYAIDGQLSFHVEPPKEIKEDLGQKDWFLRDSNWESDFPTAARQAEWFFTKETGEKVDGVVALDISAMEKLLVSTGPLDLPDYNEKITSENLFERAITHAELSFFPGSQAKKSFLTALTNGLFNKIFFLPQNNWSGIIKSLGESLDEKHVSIYLNDPKMFSYILSQNWGHVLPRESKENKNQDFLSLVEANLGANKVNYYLDRSYNLETVVGKEGELRHRLRISYTNRSPSDTFPGGKYKNRMRIYLPFGSKLTKALWGESDITKGVTSFVDYGRSGYSLLLELSPKEQKTLVLDYTVPVVLDFKDKKAVYRLDVIKQAGTLKDPFEWTMSYPISFKVASNTTQETGPQERAISTDLATNRSFEVEFRR